MAGSTATAGEREHNEASTMLQDAAELYQIAHQSSSCCHPCIVSLISTSAPMHGHMTSDSCQLSPTSGPACLLAADNGQLMAASPPRLHQIAYQSPSCCHPCNVRLISEPMTSDSCQVARRGLGAGGGTEANTVTQCTFEQQQTPCPITRRPFQRLV
jgi:hypothetical protein